MTASQIAKCPTCAKALAQHVILDIVVDECTRCGGIWFDAGELDNLVTNQIEETARDDSDLNEVHLPCPLDSNPLLMAKVDDVTLHTCIACGGLWLDGLSVNTLLGVLPSTAEEPENQQVNCAGCGQPTHRDKAAFRFDDYWCEACVVAGDYPGSSGKTLANQRTEMALTLGRETRRLHAAKANSEGLKALSTRITPGTRGLKVEFGLLNWLVRKIRG